MWYAAAGLAQEKENGYVNSYSNIVAIQAENDTEAKVKAEIVLKEAMFEKHPRMEWGGSQIYPIPSTEPEPLPEDLVGKVNQCLEEILDGGKIKDVLGDYFRRIENLGYQRGLAESSQHWQDLVGEIKL
jgi:hypothetical protein